MRRVVEFFESDEGPLSMSRLMMFGTFVTASAIMAVLTARGEMNEGYFGMFLAFGGGTYLTGKQIDRKAAAGGTRE